MKRLTFTRKLVISLAIVVAFAGIYPASYSLCPDWNVTVVDVSGTPVPGMTVRRICNDYSSGSVGIEEDAITDEFGSASFAGKSARSSLFFRWVGNAMNVVSEGVHASFGRYSYVFAFGRGMEGSPVVDGYVENWDGGPEHMESRIIVKPVRPIPAIDP